MQTKVLFIFLMTISSLSLFAQDSYHRLYETNLGRDFDLQEDTIFYHMSSATVNGNVTAMGTTRILDDNITLIFTNHDTKGNVKWSTEIDLGLDTTDILNVGEMMFNEEKDSILFTIDAEINGEKKQLFGKTDAAGNNLEVRIVGGNEFATLGSIPKLTAFIQNSTLLVTQGDRPTISRLTANDDLLWSRTFEMGDDQGGDAEFSAINDLRMTADSTFVILGTSNGSSDFIVAELDSNGVQLWAESYTFSSFPDGFSIAQDVVPTEIYPLESGNTAIVGEFTVDFSSPSYGFVMVVDTSGEAIFTKAIDALNEDGQKRGSLRNVIQAEDGSIWMSGVYTSVSDSVRYFMTNIDEAGVQNWTTVYGESTTDDPLFTTSVFNVDATGGVTLVGHGFKNNLELMTVMKHTPDGLARCSDTMSVRMVDMTVEVDTLISDAVNGGLFFTDFELEGEPFTRFTPPVLNIMDAYQFCPNEPIDTILVASVGEVEEVTYQWGNEDGEIPGAINDTLRIMEEGEYSVTVTIAEDVCYVMCDTIEVTRINPPMASISGVDISTCANGAVIPNFALDANVENGRPPFDYIWSTGEVSEIITTTEPGFYSVSVTDACGEMSSATFNMVPSELLPPQIVFDQSGGSQCANGAVIEDYSLEVSNALGTPLFTYLWSTGETTARIENLIVGTYSVTVTDDCGETASASYDIVPDEFAPFDVTMSSVDNSFCDDGRLVLDFELNTNLSEGNTELSYLWSTGETTAAINVSEVGDYSVTVTNTCGEVATSSIEAASVVFEPEAFIALNAMEFCSTGEAILTGAMSGGADRLSGPNPEQTFEWSTGETGMRINITNPGEYSVTITDECGFVAEVTENVEFDTDCGAMVQFAKVFFPGGSGSDAADAADRVFGPIPNDTMNVLDRISDIDFKIFNRWGEEVYSSDTFSAWDGNTGGDPAPTEVYIWYFAYSLSGEQQETLKGDITLVR